MASYNKVILMGNLTRDVQLKHTASQAVADISIAVNRKFKTKDGQEREEVTYVDCECWGPRAEVIAKFFSKGKPIFIEGRLKLDSWEDKDGQKRSKLKVSIDSFEFVGGSGGGAGGGGEYTREEGSSDSSRSSGGGGGGGGGGSRGGNSSHSGIQEEESPF